MNTVDLLTRADAAAVAVNRAQQLKMHDIATQDVRFVKRISPRNGGQTYFVVILLYKNCDDSGEATGVISPGGTYITADQTEFLSQQQLYI